MKGPGCGRFPFLLSEARASRWLSRSVYITRSASPLALSLSKGERRFDRFTTSGLLMTCHFRKQVLVVGSGGDALELLSDLRL